MTVPAGVLDYFADEAAGCLDRIARWLDAAERDPATPADDARRAARTLRGAAGIAHEPGFAEFALTAERVLGGPPAQRDTRARAAVAEALAAAQEALGAARPRPAAAVERLHRATAALGALAEPATTVPPDGDGECVVPIRALAHDGDPAFVVHRAEHPPITADRRFRAASVSLARAIRERVARARAAVGGDAAAAQAVGADLRAAVGEVRALAASYDVAPVATFFARRERGAAALDPRTLAALDAAAAGLIGELAEVVAPEPPAVERPNAAPQDAPALVSPASEMTSSAAERADAFRRPTGEALVALLETGITGLGDVGQLDLAPADAPAPVAAGTVPGRANGATPPDADLGAIVPIATLLYHGRAALDRARTVRDALRARPGPPDPTLLAELYDLLDLAAG